MNEITQTKICSKCKVEQDFYCFSKYKHAKDGISSICKVCRKIYYNDNKEKLSLQKKEYRKENKEQIRLYGISYHIAHRVKHNINAIKYYQNNKEKMYKKAMEYSKTKKGKEIQKNKKYRRRSITQQGDVTTLQLMWLKDNAKVCYWCDYSLKKVKVHIDHYIPLSKGGEHTLSNLVVSCQRCNQQKCAKEPLKFANEIGKLL